MGRNEPAILDNRTAEGVGQEGHGCRIFGVDPDQLDSSAVFDDVGYGCAGIKFYIAAWIDRGAVHQTAVED